MRCPDCNKFVPLTFEDPEVESLEIDDTTVRATVRICRSCEECGQELKEATLEMEECLSAEELEGHAPDPDGKETKHVLEIEETAVNQIEEGGGRYKKSFFGAEVCYRLTCSCDKDAEKRWEFEGAVSDKVAASCMDEMV